MVFNTQRYNKNPCFLIFQSFGETTAQMITLNLPEGKTDSIEIAVKFDFRRQGN